MKYILLLFLAISLIARGQDIVKLSPQEMFDFNSKWNNLGTSQTYIDFSKDILSTSDISFGIVGQQVSTTINASYNFYHKHGEWNHIILSSINPVWKYYGIGYGLSKTTSKRTSTLQLMTSSDFNFQNNITISVIDVYNTKKLGKFGWNVTASNTNWGEWEGPWEGEYLVDSLGNWIANIYPINPASSQLTIRATTMYTYPISTKIVDISPQLFITSDIYKLFNSPELNIGYFDDLNLDVYYGVNMIWKVTKKFNLSTTIRLNSTYEAVDLGFKKSNPILFMIGTSF
jgi:hypothetical protein